MSNNSKSFFLHYGDLTDPISINRLINLIKPDEILKESEIEFLKKKDNKSGFFLILHAWFIILLCILIFVYFIQYLLFIESMKHITITCMHAYNMPSRCTVHCACMYYHYLREV